MKCKQLNEQQVGAVRHCLERLAAYHNSISSPFAGIYPTLSIDGTLAHMAEQLRAGDGLLCAVYEENRVVGCMYASVQEQVGTLECLYLDESMRGKGYGDMLMQEALGFFRRHKVSIADIRVLEGNPAQAFYKKYGFMPRTRILSLQMQED